MGRMHRFLPILAALLLLGGPLQGQHPEVHSEHFLYGNPTGAPASNDLIIRNVNTLSSSDETKLGDWLVYRLDYRIVEGGSDSQLYEVRGRELEPAAGGGAFTKEGRGDPKTVSMPASQPGIPGTLQEVRTVLVT